MCVCLFSNLVHASVSLLFFPTAESRRKISNPFGQNFHYRAKRAPILRKSFSRHSAVIRKLVIADTRMRCVESREREVVQDTSEIDVYIYIYGAAAEGAISALGAIARSRNRSHENSKVDLHVIFEYRIYGSETFFSHARTLTQRLQLLLLQTRFFPARLCVCVLARVFCVYVYDWRLLLSSLY